MSNDELQLRLFGTAALGLAGYGVLRASTGGAETVAYAFSLAAAAAATATAVTTRIAARQGRPALLTPPAIGAYVLSLAGLMLAGLKAPSLLFLASACCGWTGMNVYRAMGADRAAKRTPPADAPTDAAEPSEDDS